MIIKVNESLKNKNILLSACSKADTGVGASIEQGNQLCNGR